MSDATAFLKERPVLAGAIVLGVAVMAYLASRGSDSSTTTDYAFRGDVAKGIDPNAAAIEQAAIAAGTQNLATIANLAGLQDSNANALKAELAQTNAAKTVSLSSIAANLKAALFQTEASRDVSLAQTGATVSIAEGANATQLRAAELNDSFNRTSLAAQQQMYALHEGTERFQIQSQKDIARANANAGIIGDIFGGVASFFGGFF